MHRRNRFLPLTLMSTLPLIGCASVDPRPDFDEARAMIQATTGVPSVFDPELPVLSTVEIDAFLAGGLTLDEALKLALLNNRRLQAGFLELGVGRAEFVQASLLQNPTLSLAFLFPAGGGRPKISGDLLASLADVWQLPRRKEFARLNQERRLLDLSRFAGELVVETKSAYFDIVSARQARVIAAENVKLADAALVGVRRQVEGGVAMKTDESLAHSFALGAELETGRWEREESLGVQRLATLLSLTTDPSSIELTDALPASALLETDTESIVTRSLELRLDVRAAALAVSAADAEVRLERSRAVPAAAVGLAAERPERGSSTNFLGGVAGSIELPVFDQNQAQVSRAEFERDALAKEFEALSADVAQEVRGALNRLAIAQRTASFVRDELLPQAERGAALAARAYDLGDTTVLALIESQRRVLQARQGLINALAEAARTQVDVERQLGAPLAVMMRNDNSRFPDPAK